MRRLLSIFSFNTIKAFPILTRAFYWSILWIGCLILTANFFLKSHMNISTSRIGKAITHLNNSLNEKNNNKEFVLFLGSSRFQTAINIRTLAEMSHIKNITFLNPSRPSMGPWHYSVILRNTEMPLSRVKHVFLEISPWMFNANALNPITKESLQLRDEILKWGNIQERLEIKETTQRIEAMTIGMMPRAPLLDFISVLKEPEPVIETVPEFEANQNSEKVLGDNPYFKAENISKCHLYKFEFLQSEANKLLELIRELERFGVAVSLIHPPVKSEYYYYLDTDSRYRSEFEKYKNFIKRFSNKHHVIYWETSPDAGLDNSIFVDYGHLSREGSILFTRRLGVEINHFIE